MSQPRSSIFRDALQISPVLIANLGDDHLNELMRDLLRAQAYRCHSSSSEVRTNTEDKAKDDGCDGWTSKPDIADQWLGDADTCWQFKAGKAGTPSRLIHEVIKPIPSRTLKANGWFVVVATGSTNGPKGESDRLEKLRIEAQATGIPTDKIVVIGSERLTTWCNQNPAVAARWAGRPEGLWTLADWSNAEVHQVPWQASEKVNATLVAKRADLNFENGSVQHLHIHGQPGVGKTRFALELCREAPWAGFVIYIQQASDLRLQELIDCAANEGDVRLVVVADEVQQEQLLPLRDSIERGNGRIRLVTIGHCPTPDSARIPAIRVEPLDDVLASKVVKGWYPALPVEHIDFVVRFADGYVRLARLAADAVARHTTIDVRGLISRDEIRSFLDRMLGYGDRRSLYVVAVISSIGWTEERMAEGEAVSRHFGLDWNKVRADVDDYHRRFGIAPRSGRYRYISPTPLGNHLAVEAWTTYPDLLRTLPNALPTNGAKEEFYKRLRLIASNPQAGAYSRQELAFFTQLEHFSDAQSVQRWSLLMAADPDQAARNIYRALNACSVEERSLIKEQARREMVWALVRLAWRSSSFADATKALALLAEAENETWANNASSEFVGRYQILLGGTAVPYLERLLVLDELLGENRAALNRLVVRALARASETHAVRMGSEPPSDELPEKEWHPTREEYRQCIQAALERLAALANRADPDLQDVFISTAKEFAMWLPQAPVRPLVETFFAAVRSGFPDTRELLRRVIADVIKRERKYMKRLSQDELAELDALHTRYEDPSLKARLRQHVGQPPWEHEEHPHFEPLAKEILESAGAFAEEWSWLTSGEAADAWRFGEALAEVDPERILAPLFITLHGTGRDLRVLCGYINVWRLKLGDDWYDQWIETLMQNQPRAINILLEIIWRCGVTASGARHLADVLRTNVLAPEIVGQLSYGTWAEKLDPDSLENILHALVEGHHTATALTILENRTKAILDEHERWRRLVEGLITTPELVCSNGMTSYHWKELALRYVFEYAAEIAAAIMREQNTHSTRMWFATDHEVAEVLRACAEQDPGRVWAALLPYLSSKKEAYWFSLGFPQGVVDRLPRNQVLSWIDAQPNERASIIAKLIIKDLSSDNTLEARILGDHGDKDEVASAFFAEHISGSWWGSASVHWDQLANELGEVAKRTKLRKLKSWATRAASELRKMANQDRRNEEEENVRRPK